MAFFRSVWVRGLVFLLLTVLLFSAGLCYIYANDNAGMGEIFTYTDFRNTIAYSSRLSDASKEMESLARQVYNGKQISSVDLEGTQVDGAFHYYFYADGVVLTDIPFLEGVDFSHAKTLAVYRSGLCYIMDTSHTQTEYFSLNEQYSWNGYDLTKTVSLSAFSCDAGAILVPDSNWINEQYSVWGNAKNCALFFILLLSLSAIPITFFVLCVSWNALPRKTRRHGAFTELKVFSGILAVIFLIQILEISYFRWLVEFLSLFGYGNDGTAYAVYSFLFTLLILLLLFSVLSLISAGKDGKLLRGSLLWWICHKPFSEFRNRMNQNYLRKYRYSVIFALRTALFLLIEAVLLACFIVTSVHNYWIVVQILLIFAALSVGFLYVFANVRDMRSLNRLLEHITALQNGNLSFRAEIDSGDIFAEYEEQLRAVGDGFDQTLRSQVAAERSRVNLITNVSHDLRTPLTSIIGYLDLLSKAKLSDEARDYVRILTQKSNRLNHLVSDVFALSKANSGAEEVPVEELDLFLLARQLVADLSDSASAAGKTVRLSGEGTAPVCSNGNKIYRILQNMLDNALKYSLSGTRVFVSLDQDGNTATVTVKNTSSYEMNFTAEEISEQFVRGDPSRTGEGSGLGLAIAKSFAEQLGASFKISVDGDQFVSSVSFPLNLPISSESKEQENS